MMKTLRPVFRPPAEADEVDEDEDVELELEDEHAASRTDTMTKPLVSQAVCLSFISESFQSDRWEKPAGAARRRRWSRPASAVWLGRSTPRRGDLRWVGARVARRRAGPRGEPLAEPTGQGRRIPAEDGQEQQRAGDDTGRFLVEVREQQRVLQAREGEHGE